MSVLNTVLTLHSIRTWIGGAGRFGGACAANRFKGEDTECSGLASWSFHLMKEEAGAEIRPAEDLVEDRFISGHVGTEIQTGMGCEM